MNHFIMDTSKHKEMYACTKKDNQKSCPSPAFDEQINNQCPIVASVDKIVTCRCSKCHHYSHFAIPVSIV